MNSKRNTLKLKFKFICVKCNQNNILDKISPTEYKCLSCDKYYYIYTRFSYNNIMIYYHKKYKKGFKSVLIASREMFKWK